MVDLKSIKAVDEELYDSMVEELRRQQHNLELIASENIVSPAVMAAAGSYYTNKYAEGYPGKRYYGGCGGVDQSETSAIERLKQNFGGGWGNVKPPSRAHATARRFTASAYTGGQILGV